MDNLHRRQLDRNENGSYVGKAYGQYGKMSVKNTVWKSQVWIRPHQQSSCTVNGTLMEQVDGIWIPMFQVKLTFTDMAGGEPREATQHSECSVSMGDRCFQNRSLGMVNLDAATGCSG